MVVWRFGLTRDVEKVDTHEDDQEATNKGNGVDPSGGVEPLEKDSRGDDGACGESDIVYWIHTATQPKIFECLLDLHVGGKGV